jgi:pimeloyl-ACP methyl ester carboxylesterase
MSSIAVEGGLVNYVAYGRGYPILLIHGWLGSWRYWWSTMSALASQDYRSYALDLWGFGGSDRFSQGYSLDGYVALIRDFLDALGIYRSVIVGHALGAAVAVDFASREPERVEKVVAVSFPLSIDAINQRLSSPEKHLQRLLWSAPPQVVDEARLTDPEVFPRTLESFAQVDLGEKLRHLECSVLVVCGEEDNIVDPRPVYHLSEEDHIQLVSFANARHFPMVEESARFDRLIQDFLVE